MTFYALFYYYAKLEDDIDNRVILVWSDKPVLSCFFESKLESFATVIPNHREKDKLFCYLLLELVLSNKKGRWWLCYYNGLRFV